MTEPRSHTDQQLYEQRACQSLVHHSGWREVLLPMVAKELEDCLRTASNPQVSPEMRLSAVDRQTALLLLLRMIYRKADEVNPFDAARGAVWSTLLPPRERDLSAQPEANLRDSLREALAPPENEPKPAKDDAAMQDVLTRVYRRSGGGSIA